MIKLLTLLIFIVSSIYPESKSELNLVLDASENANFELQLWKENPGADDEKSASIPEIIKFKGNRYKLRLDTKNEYVYFRVREIGMYGSKGYWTEVNSTDPSVKRPVALANDRKINNTSNPYESSKSINKINSRVNVNPAMANGFIVLPDKESYISYLSADQLKIMSDDSLTSSVKTFYNINDGVWQTLRKGEALNFSEEREYHLQYYSMDLSGNKEEIKSIFFRKDSLPPITNIIWMDDKKALIQHHQPYLAPDSLLKLAAFDSGSGVKESLYAVDCLNQKPLTFQKYESPIALSKILSKCKSNFRLSIYSIDLVGNSEIPHILDINYSSFIIMVPQEK